jgi:murein DD-endopeptidase MepM/ murein hydrolase activator NlpD
VQGRIISAFGPKPNGQHNDGFNIAVPENTPIKAAEDGIVAYAGNELKGYGNLCSFAIPTWVRPVPPARFWCGAASR